RLIERGERLEHRAVIVAEDLDEMLGRPIAKGENSALGRDAGMRADQASEIGLCPPKSRGPHAGSGRHVLADELKQPADEALGRPIGEANSATATADAHELARGALMIRREHDAEGR